MSEEAVLNQETPVKKGETEKRRPSESREKLNDILSVIETAGKTAPLNLNRDMKDDYNYKEAIKTLRTNIQFCGNSIRVIMFTSSVPGEGKSDTSFALAESLAQIGKKVLFIDADIRKSVLTTRYQLEREVDGLSQYLSGQRRLEQVIYDTNIENLRIIFAGPYSPNPAELLEEDLCRKMFESLRSFYDYIIVDTPPMGNLIDGAIIATHCDGAVMVIESGAVSYRLEQKVKDQLEKAGCRILGVVLNKVDIHNNGYYGVYGKYGKYKKYGEYGRAE